MLEFRTSYNRLNKYRHQIGQSLMPYCECGEEENTEHYRLNCPRYHQEKEEMESQLEIQNIKIDLQTLLEPASKETYKEQ